MSRKREIKDALYDQVARLAKAVASPKRLELVELLCQAPKTVETLAQEAEISLKLASAHLKELKASRLVVSEREGKYVRYRLASPEVAQLWVSLRLLAEDRLFELQAAAQPLRDAVPEWAGHCRDDLIRQAERGELVLLDVRPAAEYAAAHLPQARSLPLAELAARLAELPRDRPIVAYCRGPFCFWAGEAVALLRAQGYSAWQLRDGVAEWGVLANPTGSAS